MSQRLDRDAERRYILPSEGVKRDWFRALYYYVPRIPNCTFAPDVIIGSGEYDAQTGYWSEYDCVSESAFSDQSVNRKSGMQP